MNEDPKQLRARVTTALADLDLTFSILSNAEGNREWVLEFAGADGAPSILIRIRAFDRWVLVFHAVPIPEDVPSEVFASLLRAVGFVPVGSIALLDVGIVASCNLPAGTLSADALRTAIDVVQALVVHMRDAFSKAGVPVADPSKPPVH